MNEIALEHAGKIMHLVMQQSGIPWESPFGPHEYNGMVKETFAVDVTLLVIGVAEGYWKKWLMNSKRAMIGVAKYVGYERYIRNFLWHYFEMIAENDMVNVLIMIMYILVTSVELYSRNVTDAPVAGVRILAEVLEGKARNKEEMGDRFNRIHATACEIMRDRKYFYLDILDGDS